MYRQLAVFNTPRLPFFFTNIDSSKVIGGPESSKIGAVAISACDDFVAFPAVELT